MLASTGYIHTSFQKAQNHKANLEDDLKMAQDTWTAKGIKINGVVASIAQGKAYISGNTPTGLPLQFGSVKELESFAELY